jgi:hypothetical protein
MANDKLKVGQTVWFVEKDNRTGKAHIPKETTITEVGRIYFKVECRGKYKFSIEKMQVVSDHNLREYIYLDIEVFKKEERYSELLSDIRKVFGHYGKTDVTLEQLEAINKILNPSKE